MARFQINFTTGIIIHPPKEFGGSYEEAKVFAEKECEHYPPGTRYHISKWRFDPVCPVLVSCDDQDFKSC